MKEILVVGAFSLLAGLLAGGFALVGSLGGVVVVGFVENRRQKRARSFDLRRCAYVKHLAYNHRVMQGILAIKAHLEFGGPDNLKAALKTTTDVNRLIVDSTEGLVDLGLIGSKSVQIQANKLQESLTRLVFYALSKESGAKGWSPEAEDALKDYGSREQEFLRVAREELGRQL